MQAQTSIGIRINGALRPFATDLPTDAVFPIYSITKTLTAICVLRLCERGEIAVDAPASRSLPDVDLPRAITIEHLLRHTSGLGDYGYLPQYHAAVRAHPDQPWTRQQYLDAVLPRGPLFPPGARFSYSNVGYMLLVDLLERVTGDSFARALATCVVAPLSLRATSVLETLDDLARCVPGFGTEVTADGSLVDVRGRYHPGWCAPRVVASTVEEVTRVFEALFAGELLKPSTLEQMLMTVPLSSEPSETIGVGMGIYSDAAAPGGSNCHHGGGGPGYDLSATVYPRTPRGRVAIAVFVNTSTGPRAADLEPALVKTVLAARS
jgi:D-alanyl-D-alanine carboxypeptidase